MIVALAPTAKAESENVSAGTANWGVKASWRNYILNFPPPAGTIETSDGATTAPDGTFDFTAASGDIEPDGSAGSLAFDGRVTFEKAGHGILITLENPRLEWSGDTGTLYASGVSQGSDYDTDVATLDLSGIAPDAAGDQIAFADIPATLSEDGEVVFDGNYPAGTALDPVSFSVTTGDAPVVPGVGAIKPGKAEQKLRKGAVKLARIKCSADCEVAAARRVKAKVKGGPKQGKSIRLKIDAPAGLAAGEKYVVTAKANRRAKRLLKGGRAKVKTKLRLSGGVETVTKTVKVKVSR